MSPRTPSKDEALLQRLLHTFKGEAQEHIEAIASGLVHLEKAPTSAARAGALDAVFRAAHSLKGAARTVALSDIERLCQSLESVFAALKNHQIAPTAELFDLLHRVVAALGQLLQSLDAPAASSTQPQLTGLVQALQGALTRKSPPASGEQLEPQETAPEGAGGGALDSGAANTIRVETGKLDAVVLQAEELLSTKLAAAQRVLRLQQLQARSADWKKKWAKLRPELRALRQSLGQSQGQSFGHMPVARLLEFLEWNRDLVETLDAEVAALARTADHEQRAFGTMVDTLLADMQKLVMQPFSRQLAAFPRFVRELSREQGKDVELIVHGAEIEIDRRILEEMKDALIHLVRNCLDHGIELPAMRVRKGKPARGAITITVSPKDGRNVELLIADNGAGIEAAKVKTAAVKMGMLSQEKADTLSDQQSLSFIFHSGVSTSPVITDISGRGLGLAIVKERVEKLNGALFLETEPGIGTTFRIILPLTLARFSGVVVRVDEHLFVLPTSSVERVARVGEDDIKTVENRATITLNDETLSLAQLSEVLELPRAAAQTPSATRPVVVLVSARQRIAFVVDEVLHEQEVLVKSLGKHLARVPNIAGATVLGGGKVVPIINVQDLMKSAVHSSHTRIKAPMPAAASETKKRSVLVAEDSITSRSLLKNILETAGYRVDTAVDGIDAFTKLRSSEFDVVVSDVDMPRMNGFGLTAKIRAESKLKELPVVLVTALESRSDREHGIDVGANAYIVKSSFDQSNLLEVLRRLI